MNRRPNLTQKIATPFGSMYVHVEFDPLTGRACNASISDPQKEPDAQVAKLVRALSDGLGAVLDDTAAT